MTLYAKIACDIARDPKMLAAGPLARLLYIQAVLYCRENLTDGYIDRRVVAVVAVDVTRPGRLMDKLCQVGAMEKHDDGWLIPPHAWAKWNPTRADVDEIKEIKREAGERGNHERWHVAGNKLDPKCRLCFPKGSPRHRTVRGNGIADCDESATPMRIAPVSPEPKPEPEPEPEPYSLSSPSYLKTPPTDPDEREKISNVLKAVFNGTDDPHAETRRQRKLAAEEA